MTTIIGKLPSPLLAKIFNESNNPSVCLVSKACKSIYEKGIMQEGKTEGHNLPKEISNETDVFRCGEKLTKDEPTLTCDTSKNTKSILGRLEKRLNANRMMQFYRLVFKNLFKNTKSISIEDARKKFENECSKNFNYIILDKKKIQDVPKELFIFSFVKMITLNKNKLNCIPPDIKKLPSLETFTAIDNNITHIPREIGECNSLTVLAFTKNNLHNLPLELSKLKKLKTLLLEENKIHSIPPEIGNLDSLLSLSLQDNKLEVVPSAIGNLRKIQSLNLSKNQLKTLPPEISKLKGNIVINNNPIEYLPSQLSELATGPYDNTIFNLDGDSKLMQGNSNNLPVRLLNLIKKSSYEKVFLEMKNLKMKEQNFQNAIDPLSAFYDIITTKVGSLHEQQIAEVAIDCIELVPKDILDALIEKLALTNDISKLEAKELLTFHPCDFQVQQAVKILLKHHTSERKFCL